MFCLPSRNWLIRKSASFLWLVCSSCGSGFRLWKPLHFIPVQIIRLSEVKNIPMKRHHRSSFPSYPSLLVASLFLGGTAWAAQPVTITNPSFEDSSSGTPAGWTDVNGGADAFVPGTGQYNPLTKIPNGANVASIFDGAAGDGISQTLAATLQPGNSYTLTVQIGVPADAAFAGYTIQLLAGGNVLAQDDNTQTPATGDFTAATATYVYDAGDAALIGQPLEIRLLGKGLGAGLSDVNFDAVQLTVTLGNPLAVPGGPYTAFVGGSLVLNGSGSLPSDGQTITSYEWDLDNDGDFDEAITGASPAAIPQADLVATYGMSSGSNTIKLRVTDSAAKTSTVEATVKIVPATAVVYEPFAYSQATLNGASGNIEKGFSDPWVAHNDTKLGANLPFGSLLTQGAGIGNLTGGQNRFGGRRALDASALAGNGLLDDGATLWFSVNMGYGSGRNSTNARLMLMLGTESLLSTSSGASYYFPTPGATGLGVFLGRFTFNGTARNGIMVATHVRDSTFGANNNVNTATLQNHIYGTGLGTSILPSTPNTNVDYAFIVGRIRWGAESDTIELFRPNQNLEIDLTKPHSTLTVDVDQSGYDTISFARGDIVVLDEIRFGATYSSVTQTGSFWDINGAVAGAGSDTPSGTWGTDSNWTTEPNGTAATGPWAPGRTAVFSAGNDATGAYTVTVDGTQDIGGITFQDGTVNIEGGTALRLTSNADLTVAAGQTASISTAFTEQEAGLQLSKSGAGTLVLSGDNSGVTGGMVLAGGATVFESPASIAGSSRNAAIGTTGTAAFGPGFSSGDLATALANRITADSTGTIAVDHHAATDFDFNTLGLTAAYLGAVANQTYTGTLTPNGTTYRLGGGGGTLSLPTANALTGNNGLDVRGSVTLLADNDYTGPTVVNGESVLRIMGTSATSGIRVKQPGGLLEINSDGSLGSGTLTIDSGFGTRPTVSVLSDVVASNPVNFLSDWNLQGSGSLTVGPVTYANTKTIGNNNTGLVTFASITSPNGVLTLEGNGSLTTGKIAIGTGTLTKRGTGTLTLTGDNTYTGATSITAGTLALAGGSQSSAITISNGATLEFTLGSPTTSTAALILSTGHKIAVSGTPTLASYTLMTAASFTGAPNVEPAITGYELVLDGTTLKLNAINSGSPYTTWAGGFTGLTDANPSLDFDAGGLATALEWVLGGDPSNGSDDAGIAPTIDNTTDPDFFIFSFNRRDDAKNDANTAIKVQYGSDLAGWTEAVAGADIEIAETDNGATDLVKVKIRRTLAVGGKLFARLNVVVTTP